MPCLFPFLLFKAREKPAPNALPLGVVVAVAWILAYSVAGLGRFYSRMQAFQKWLNRIVALLFIAVGVYYGIIYYF